MTIITHNLGMSYLDDSQLIAELIHFEANIPVPYADSKGIASIGIGVNLRANGDNYLALVLDQLGVFTTYIGQVNARIKGVSIAINFGQPCHAAHALN